MSGLDTYPMPRTARVAVLGIGNTLMGDDGVGVAVVAPYADGSLGPDVTVVLGETAGMGLLRHFREADAVLYVDAIDAGAEPGAVFRFDPDEAGITGLRSNNIHGMGVGNLVTAARFAGSDPVVVVLAVQVGDVRQNDRVLTPAVEAAVPEVRRLIEDEVRRLLGSEADVSA